MDNKAQPASPTGVGSSWDIRHAAVEGSRAGISELARSTPAYALALALSDQPEFWEQVAKVRQGTTTAMRTASQKYFTNFLPTRHHERARLLAYYLWTAAQSQDEQRAMAQLPKFGVVAYFINGEPGTKASKRALRKDGRQTLLIGALRIARRGAGRCVAHDCPARNCGEHGCEREECTVHRPGALLSRYSTEDYCSACMARSRRPSEAEEAERSVSDGAIAAVYGGEARPARRRTRSLMYEQESYAEQARVW